MSLWQDIRFAVRSSSRIAGSRSWPPLALALGIGVNTAVFTFVNAVLIRGLPFDDPDRIMSLGTTDARGRQTRRVAARLRGLARVRAKRSPASASCWAPPMNISEEGRAPEQFQGIYGSANMFQLIGARPVARPRLPAGRRQPGRRAGRHHRRRRVEEPLRRRPGGARPDDQGQQLAVTVIGVMPPDMQFPFNNDIWMPLSQLPPAAREPKRGVRNFQVFGRLAPRRRPDAGARRARKHRQPARDATIPTTNKDIRPT